MRPFDTTHCHWTTPQNPECHGKPAAVLFEYYHQADEPHVYCERHTGMIVGALTAVIPGKKMEAHSLMHGPY